MSDCDFRGDWCTTHNSNRCTDTSCETGFYAGFVDMTTDEQRRANRDSDVRGLVRDIKRALSWNCTKIKQPTDDDKQIEEALRRAGVALAMFEKPESAPNRRRRR